MTSSNPVFETTNMDDDSSFSSVDTNTSKLDCRHNSRDEELSKLIASTEDMLQKTRERIAITQKTIAITQKTIARTRKNNATTEKMIAESRKVRKEFSKTLEQYEKRQQRRKQNIAKIKYLLNTPCGIVAIESGFLSGKRSPPANIEQINRQCTMAAMRYFSKKWSDERNKKSNL